MNEILEFLKESNAIENEWSADSLLQAFYAWEYVEKQPKMNFYVILKTHQILMKNRPLLANERGKFRKQDVYIGGHKAKPWFVVEELVGEWIKRVNEALKKKWKEKEGEHLSQGFHVQYEGIHPFIDGNGRTGRIFMNWFRLQIGLPLLIIKEKEKFEYYKWFD